MSFILDKYSKIPVQLGDCILDINEILEVYTPQERKRQRETEC